MISSIISNISPSTENLTFVRQQLTQGPKVLAFLKIINKIKSAIEPYFKPGSTLNRVWSVARDRIASATLAERAAVAVILTAIVSFYAYYRSQREENLGGNGVAGQPAEADNKTPLPSPFPFPLLAASNECHLFDRSGLLSRPSSPSTVGSASENGSSSSSFVLTREGVEETLSLLQGTDGTTSFREKTANSLLQHLGSIADMDSALHARVANFFSCEFANNDVKAKVDYMKPRSPQIEEKIERMIEGLLGELVKEAEEGNRKDFKNIYRQLMMESFRENAILALEKEANKEASEAHFNKHLSKMYRWEHMKDDGDCFFHAIAFNVGGDQARVREALLAEKQKEKHIDAKAADCILKSATQGGDQGVSSDAYYLANFYQKRIWIHSHIDPQESRVGEQYAVNGTIHLFYNGLNHWDTFTELKK